MNERHPEQRHAAHTVSSADYGSNEFIAPCVDEVKQVSRVVSKVRAVANLLPVEAVGYCLVGYVRHPDAFDPHTDLSALLQGIVLERLAEILWGAIARCC